MPAASRDVLATWFSGPRALARFRDTRLGRAPIVLRARDAAWRAIAPDFDTVIAMAASGVPFQIAAERRYDRSGDPRSLRRALDEGATIFFPQVHQVLPRLMRLIVALRVTLLGPRKEECSFLFGVEGRGRTGMGLHHDGPVDAFWLQLEGRRTVTLGPPVAPGTPQDLPPTAERRVGWRTLELSPGSLFHLPPWTPHDVVCHGRSLALSLTWTTAAARGARARTAALVAWDVASGSADALPPMSRRRLWTQVPAIAGSRSRSTVRLTTPDGVISLPIAVEALANRLGGMPYFALPDAQRPPTALALLLEHGIVGPQDLPLRIIPTDTQALDGWRFR
jgi:JmjC domain